MTTDLEPRIRELFRELADHTTITPDVDPATPTVRRARSVRSRWNYVTAAAATIALVAAVVIVRFDRDTTPAGPTPGPGEPVGIFPAGDAERVVAVGYQSPLEAALGYMNDRLSLDEGTTDVAMELAAITLPDRNLVMVSVGVDSGPGDSSGGAVFLERVETRNGDSGWVVKFARLGVPDATDVTFVGGVLTASLTHSGLGERVVEVYDATTSGLIFRDDLGANVSGTDQLEISDVLLPAVAVRYSASSDGPDDPDGGEFLEFLVRAGERWSQSINEVHLDLSAAASTSVRFDGDPISALVGLEPGEPRMLVDDGEVTVWAELEGDLVCLRADGRSEIARGGMCSPVEEWSGLGSMRTGSYLSPLWFVLGIVPDSVGSVSDAAGREIPIENNIWYDVISGTPHAYVVTSVDGSVTETVWVGSLTVEFSAIETTEP